MYVFFRIVGLLLLVHTVVGQGSQPVKKLDLRVGILGCPSYPQVDWDDKNMAEMKRLGFNAMQLNIAWGYRPNDEPLNLEDVVQLPANMQIPLDVDSAKTLRTDARINARAAELKKRIALCKKYGMRTIFHFGAPFVGYPATEPLENCISDPKTTERYVWLINEFSKQFPGMDDLLVYTYDQNAWLCSEFGPCKNCHGVPLDKRVSKFVNHLGRAWKKQSPKGTVWWEPWEISAGEVYSSIEMLDSICVSLSIHSSIAEVQIALPADRWFKNVLRKAAERKIDVLGEAWLGAPTEEMEPYLSIATPLATLHALRAMNNAGYLKGIKEYFGNIPNKEDPNLKMTALFFANPNIADEAAIQKLAAPYGSTANDIGKYWQLTSEAIEMYPWDVSWLAREVGRNDPEHLLTAAVLKGASWQTPSWQSSRRAAFMRTDQTDEPNFWTREDVQLRCSQAAQKMQAALAVAKQIKSVPAALNPSFEKSVVELGQFSKTTLAYAYHLQETNLADNLRSAKEMGLTMRPDNIAALKNVLQMDMENWTNKTAIAEAIALLDNDVTGFLQKYFTHGAATNQKAGWNITSN
jgi:hypothetical protein